MMVQLPKDPILMLSVVNTKLRDYYKNLSLLCEDMNVDINHITSTLASIDYLYDENRNQFV